MNEYVEFVQENFSNIKINETFNEIYKAVCKNNLLTNIFLKYIDRNKFFLSSDKMIFLERFRIGVNKILLYLPLNDSIGINACMRYSIEQFLKFIYAACKEKSIEVVNKISYRHLKEDLKEESITQAFNLELKKLYTYYAKYSNEVHDKKETIENEVEFLADIIQSKNKYSTRIYEDLMRITMLSDKIIIDLFQIRFDMLAVAERITLRKNLSKKQFNRISELMKAEIV